jgi:hypothetical protein
MAAQLTQAGLTAKFRAGSTPRAPGKTAAPRSWLDRLLRRQEPTMFHRCLAVHIHHAGSQSALS